jgi:hypothetical protein
VAIDNRIVDRAYQHEAIRRVCEAFEQPSRRFGGEASEPLNNPSGRSGKRKALIDVFLRANQARNVLFVADRDALVDQAKSDGFEKFLSEPCTRLRSYNIDQTQRLYAVTLQTLSNVFEQFSPAFFDLIIFDEVHRSIFNKFSEVLQYFDARMIGLTATPANYINRDTFIAFDCHNGKPTYLYTYEQAVKDKYLVDYNLYSARTKFQRAGIRGVDLSEEERNTLIEQGLEPDDIDYEGTELEQTVSNRDTLRRQWEEIMQVCVSRMPRDSFRVRLSSLPNPGTRSPAGIRLQRNVPAVPGVGAGDHPQIRLPHALYQRLQESGHAAHRHLGGYARYRHRRARSGQPGFYETGAIADQVAADDRTRHTQPGSLHFHGAPAQLREKRLPDHRFLGKQLQQGCQGSAG